MSKHPDSTIDALIAEIDRLLAGAAKAEPEAVGICLERLRKLSPHGTWIPSLRRIAAFRNVKGGGALSQTANRWIARGRRAATQPRKPTGAVTNAHIDLCSRLLAIDRSPEPLRSLDLQAEAQKRGWSLPILLRKLRQAKEIGPDALTRRPRSNKGRCREPEEVQRFFLDRRINKATRHEMVSLSIDATRRAFPEMQISTDALYRLDRTVATPLVMTREQRRKRYLPSGQWNASHPNHTWVFDMTQADVFVWDGDPDQEPYRPHLTAIIDECTQSCMWAVYTKETPSVAILQGVLLHAILPKADPDWPQCGFPRYLHADNGKVQGSTWLRKVCASCHTKLDLMGEVRHAGIRSPWQDGHVENFFGIVHSHYESQLEAAYCGSNLKDRPACFVDPEGKGPRVWKQYPTLESLNDGFRIWVSAIYHHGMKHSRLKMTRAAYWGLHSDGYVQVVPEAYLRYELMQRDQRQVLGPRVRIFNRRYQHQDLIAYDYMALEVRWDPADLSQVLVIAPDGRPITAERESTSSVGDPKDLAAHKEWHGRVKGKLQAIDTAAEVMAGASEADHRAYENALRKHKGRQPIQFSGRRPQLIVPKKEEEPDTREALDLIRGAARVKATATP